MVRRRSVHQYEDLLVDLLLDSGFTVDEALKLVALQTNLENEAARERPWTLPHMRVDAPPDLVSFN
jgi:hypothetical protein